MARINGKELAVEKQGGTMRDLLWTIGPYDIVAVVEAPSDEVMTALALQVSSIGNVRTTTMRAYGKEEMGSIIDMAR